jgi:predicted XRE-type DNA-binding protein
MPKTRTHSNEVVRFERSSGNVFADLGLPNPGERQLKSQLMYIINTEIKRRRLTQSEAGKIVGLSQSDVSRIAQGGGMIFSIERLLSVLGKLGIDVDLVPKRTRNGVSGRALVRALI